MVESSLFTILLFSWPLYQSFKFPSYWVSFSGLSLKSQELTAMFLAVRLYCSFVMEYDMHTLLDSATLLTTLWVIFVIRTKLKSSYMEDKDNFAIYYVVRTYFLLSIFFYSVLSFLNLQRKIVQVLS